MVNKFNNKFLRLVKSVLIFFIIFLLWKIINYFGIWSDYILLLFEKVYSIFLNMISDGLIFINVYVSMKRVLIGFVISIVIGVFLGIFFGIYSGVYEYFKFLINFLRNIFFFVLILMFILWFGIGEELKIIIIVLVFFFLIFISILKGIKNCDLKLIEVGRVFEFLKF